MLDKYKHLSEEDRRWAFDHDDLSHNFTVIGRDEEGQLLYEDEDTGVVWTDGMDLEEFGEEWLDDHERVNLGLPPREKG